ncbi:Sirohydrochlorin ferrochelatase [Actinokineospora spheciospongiae]|uniref:Sirohydrochlorin ferrochelatase n=1 Tax=Actinokineospora spheciospongiae TaxID=909613 RepID=W7ITS0_9PSEU|nr:sirohydrochlorin chelatase [Actinokineospora spheciospongiae]EWC60127.1 Sirohydrochlorin ferrochelatase [Actinokineospora spheciospongiae]PWW56102.1 sirohydrochlorin ferrochelatase [Actinokineospora spheciospongiae]
MNTPLVAVAHGSRDPRSAAAVAELVAVVRARRPGLDVRTAFLDLSAPLLSDVLATLHGPVVVAPLLLGRAFHARVDLPGLVAEAERDRPRLSVTVTDVLGPDDRLEAAVLRRLAEAGVRPGDPSLGVVLAATGSSHAPANARVHEIARRWSARLGWAGVRVAFATAEPGVAAAAAALRARGARRIAVASYFLAPGLLPDRVAARAAEVEGVVAVAEPLGAAVEVADLVLARYDESLLVRVRSA